MQSESLDIRCAVRAARERWQPARVLRLACVVFAFLVFFALSACRKQQPAPPPPGPLPVNVITAVEKKVTEWEEFTGRVEAIESVEIRPRVSGYLTEVLFKEGEMVKKGDPLFRIDPRPYQADFDRAQASLAQSEAQRKLAALDFGRAEELRKKGALSAQEFDQKTAALKQAEASAGVEKAALESARLNLEFTTIESPIDGRVSDARVTVGNLVQANSTTGGVLTTVVSTDPVYIFLDADENAVLRFMEQHAAGKRRSAREEKIPAFARLGNEEGFPHEGYLDFVDNRLDPETGTLRIRGVFKAWDPLLVPGFFVRVRVASGPEASVVLVPDEVISSQQGVKYVYVVKPDNTIERRNLETGGLSNGLRIVRRGLKPGEKVVSTRLQMLRPGMEVKPVPDEKQPAQPAGQPEPIKEKAKPEQKPAAGKKMEPAKESEAKPKAREERRARPEPKTRRGKGEAEKVTEATK